MSTQITITRTSEFKKFVNENRSKMTMVNGVELGEIYPIITATRRYADYYDIDKQCDVAIKSPFVISLKS